MMTMYGIRASRVPAKAATGENGNRVTHGEIMAVFDEDRVDRVAEAAWKVLNFDNDPHDGQPHNSANWSALKRAIRKALNYPEPLERS